MLNQISTWLSYEAWVGVKMHVLVASKPEIAIRLVGFQVIQDDVNLPPGTSLHNAVHEVQELDPPAAAIVARRDHPRGHLESGKQGGGPWRFVVEARERLPIRQPEPALRPFQGLDGWFLVDAQHHRVLGWPEINTHDVRRLPGKAGVGADAPTAPPLQRYAVAPQHPPNLMLGHPLQAAANNAPFQRPYPEGGASSNSARIRRSVRSS